MSYQEIDSPPAAEAEVQVNENMAALGQGFLWSHDVTADTGLVVGLNGGDFDGNAVSDGTVSCTNNATNYIVAHRTTRALSVATTTTNWNNTSTYGRVARAVFASGVLTYHDERESVGGIFDHSASISAVAASAVTVADAGTYFAGTDAEAVLQEVGAALSGLGTGDVVGPGSATNNHVALFDGASGKLIKDSGLTLSGTNTGDQSSVIGNAGTATVLQTARTIDGVSFDGSADITVIAPATHAATNKATPVDADELPLADSAASFVLKHLTWANVKATLKTYLDTLYTDKASTQTANTVYSGPTSGAAAAPTFRAMVAADLPNAPAIDTSLGSTSGTVVVDLSLIKDGGLVRFTANGNVTALRLSNGTDGQRFTVEITQDGTGSRTVALDGTYFKFGTDITSFTATTTASKKDRIGCYCTGATTADVVAVAKGFA